MSWLREKIDDAVPPAGLAEWAAQHATAADAWRDCPRPDWQLWLAAHVRGRIHDDERNLIAAGVKAREEGPFFIHLLHYAWPIPTETDVLDAWSRDGGKTLALQQRVTASSVAFA